jgi:hypothetical protein
MGELWVSLVAGLVGALFGGAITFVIGIRQRQLENVLELHREWNAADMIKARHCGADLLDQHPGADFNQLREIVGRSAMQDIWIVQNFYQRLWLLQKHHLVTPKLIPELFGDRLSWWVQNNYQSRLFPLNNEPSEHIELLWKWLIHNCSDSQRQLWLGSSSKS